MDSQTVIKLSQILSRLDAACSAHLLRYGFSATIAAKARQLERQALATRSAEVFAEIALFTVQIAK